MVKIKRKNIFTVALLSGIMMLSPLSAYAEQNTSSSSTNSSDVRAVVPPEMSKTWTALLKKNAAEVLQFKLHDNYYPAATGMYFAERVKSNGIWDYKRTYGTTTKYMFDSITTTGEDFGNLHYGFIGRSAGFSSTVLKSAAGVVQITNGTAKLSWFSTYFDDPADQKAITRGMNYWDSPSTLPASLNAVSTLLDIADVKLTELEKAEIKKEADRINKLIETNSEYKKLAEKNAEILMK